MRQALPLVLVLAAVSGCASYGAVYVPPDRYPRQAVGPAGVPPGHMPPPGACRIWYPDRPPGQQPPPGDCRELRRRLPAGAFLVRG